MISEMFKPDTLQCTFILRSFMSNIIYVLLREASDQRKHAQQRLVSYGLHAHTSKKHLRLQAPNNGSGYLLLNVAEKQPSTDM